jgi:cytoskeleton protein RodZ
MVMAERVTADFGTRMKRAREERGISLRQIATSTKISVAALEALERNDISRLPGGIFSRAFVRSYALEIGLDPEQTVREFIAQFPHDSVTAGSPHVPQEDHAAIESERQSAQTALKLVAISVPIVGAILYFTLATGPRQTLPAAVSVPEAGPAAAGPLPPAAEPLRFEIVAKGPVALEVTVDGARHESRAFATGERLTFAAEREMTLKMSDAGAVQLTINSQPAIALGASGQERTIQIGRLNFGSFLASQ